jgi:hypothetical protein
MVVRVTDLREGDNAIRRHMSTICFFFMLAVIFYWDVAVRCRTKVVRKVIGLKQATRFMRAWWSKEEDTNTIRRIRRLLFNSGTFNNSHTAR